MICAPFHLLLIQGIGWALTDAHFGWREVWGGVGFRSSRSRRLRSRYATLALLSPFHRAGRLADGEHALASPGNAGVLGLRADDFDLGNDLRGCRPIQRRHLQGAGFDAKLYFNVLALVTIVALAANLFFGWLVNYVGLNRLLAACLLATAASLWGLPLATQPWHAYLYGIGLGIASGAVALLFSRLGGSSTERVNWGASRESPRC